MKLEMKNLFGYWNMTSMRYLNDDKVWESEVVFGGSSVFTRSGQINTFSRTSEMAFGYAGHFDLVDDQLKIDLKVCSIPELEGQAITRRIVSLDDQNLTLELWDEATGRFYQVDFALATREFAA